MSIQRLLAVCLLGAVVAACEPGEPVTPAKSNVSSPSPVAVPEAFSPGEDLNAESRALAPDAAAVPPPEPDLSQDFVPPPEEAGTLGDHDGPAMEELMSTEPPDDVPVVDESMLENAFPDDMAPEDFAPDDALPDVQEQEAEDGVSDQRQ